MREEEREAERAEFQQMLAPAALWAKGGVGRHTMTDSVQWKYWQWQDSKMEYVSVCVSEILRMHEVDQVCKLSRFLKNSVCHEGEVIFSGWKCKQFTP